MSDLSGNCKDCGKPVEVLRDGRCDICIAKAYTPGTDTAFEPTNHYINLSREKKEEKEVKEATIHCDNCGEPISQLHNETLIYPCTKCGWEFEMGQLAKPLTLSQWWAVERRIMGDLQRKFDNHKDIQNLIEVHIEFKKAMELSH